MYSEGSGTTCLVGHPHAAVLDLLSNSTARPVDEVFVEYTVHDETDRPAFDILVASLEASGLIIHC